jgi:hypothetical protein
MRIGRGPRARFDGAIRSDPTPLLGVVCLLLCFCALALRQRSLDGVLGAYLPKQVAGAANPLARGERVELAVEVVPGHEGVKRMPNDDSPWNGQGPYRYGDDRQLAVTLGTRRFLVEGELGLDLIEARLRELHGADPSLSATIRAYPGTLYEDVVKLLDRALAAGFAEVTFAAERP